MIRASDIDDWFEHHKLSANQAAACERLRQRGHALAMAIIEESPSSADQSAAIRLVRQAVWTANAGIACGGK